jgi:ubiquinone/menaquinone biosynthesis C-methylase UbiE
MMLLASAQPSLGEQVLDVACGTGIAARTVAPLVGGNGRVVGLDISPGMLAIAQQMGLPPGSAPVTWQQGNAQDLPFPAASFDLVLCQQGLQFFPDRPGAVREMRRVLRPGGRAAVSVWGSLAHNPVYERLYSEMSRRVSSPRLTVSFSLGERAALESVLTAGEWRSTTITEQQQVIRLPEPERFVELTVQAAAATLPELAQLSPEERAALVDAINAAVAPALIPYRDGDYLRSPMAAYIAVAEA